MLLASPVKQLRSLYLSGRGRCCRDIAGVQTERQRAEACSPAMSPRVADPALLQSLRVQCVFHEFEGRASWGALLIG